MLARFQYCLPTVTWTHVRGLWIPRPWQLSILLRVWKTRLSNIIITIYWNEFVYTVRECLRWIPPLVCIIVTTVCGLLGAWCWCNKCWHLNVGLSRNIASSGKPTERQGELLVSVLLNTYKMKLLLIIIFCNNYLLLRLCFHLLMHVISQTIFSLLLVLSCSCYWITLLPLDYLMTGLIITSL